MKFYNRFPGAIQIKTGHLSPTEFGCYDRLLDHYYATEQPIPSDGDRRYSICRATTLADKRAVDRVLAEFFELEQGGFVQRRAEEEIAKALPRIEASRTNGKKGGRPRKTKPTGFSGETQIETKGADLAKGPHTTDIGNVEVLPPQGVGETQEPSTAGHTPTPAGLVCKALKAAGIADVNPGHPNLAALLAAGATTEEITGFAPAALKAQAGFAWILKAAINERTRAAEIAKGLHQGPLQEAKPWHSSRKGIEDMGERLGLGRWDQQAFNLGRGETFMAYEARVRQAAERQESAA